MNKLLALALIFLTPLGFSNVNFNYGASIRSYPSVGGELEGELGYTGLLYGNPKDSIFSGLIKTHIDGGTSFVTHRYGAHISIYPLSFISVGAGTEGINSNYKDFTYYNCNQVICDISMTKSYTQLKGALKFSNILMSYKYKYSLNTYDTDGSNSVAEFQYGLKIEPDKEKQVDKNYFLGLNIKQSTLGVISNHVEFLNSKESYTLNLVIYKFNLDPFIIVLGAGHFYNTQLSDSSIAIIRLNHIISPDIVLF